MVDQPPPPLLSAKQCEGGSSVSMCVLHDVVLCFGVADARCWVARLGAHVCLYVCMFVCMYVCASCCYLLL